jgi:hypothetical protein
MRGLIFELLKWLKGVAGAAQGLKCDWTCCRAYRANYSQYAASRTWVSLLEMVQTFLFLRRTVDSGRKAPQPRLQNLNCKHFEEIAAAVCRHRPLFPSCGEVCDSVQFNAEACCRQSSKAMNCCCLRGCLRKQVVAYLPSNTCKMRVPACVDKQMIYGTPWG